MSLPLSALVGLTASSHAVALRLGFASSLGWNSFIPMTGPRVP